jgi:hypothetical protein
MTGLRAPAALSLLALAAAAPALAFAPEAAATAEQAIEKQKHSVREAVGTLPCPREGEGGDIIVCGRRGPDPNRVPFPDQRAPGEPENLLPGELPRARTSYNSCMIACPSPVTITDKDVRKYGGRILRHILGRDD